MRVAPWFEVENAYPTDASLERLEELFEEITPADAARFMLYDFKEIVDGMWAAKAWWEAWPDGDLKVMGSDARKLCFATGGWSGAEDFIEVVLKCFYINGTMHMLWKRGGYYEFEVPAHWAESTIASPATRPSTPSTEQPK